LLTVLFAAHVAQAAQQSELPEAPRLKMYVVLTVSAKGNTKDRILTTVRRLLRQSPDVEVIEPKETKPNTPWTTIYNLSIVSVGRNSGFAASILMSKPASKQSMDAFHRISTFEPTKNQTFLATDALNMIVLLGFLQNAKEIVYHGLMTDGDLDRLCNDIVVEVDTHVFEPERVSFRENIEDFRSKGLIKP